MKRIALLISFLALTVPAAYADDFTSKLDVQLISGADIPTSKLLANQYTYGYDFGVGLGYRLTDEFSVMAIVETHSMPGNYGTDAGYVNADTDSNELALQVKYMIPTGPIKPFIFAGAGFSFISQHWMYYGTYYDYTYYSSGFLMEGGVGVDIPLTDQLSVIAQSKGSFVSYSKADASYLGIDSTLTYVPIQLGVDFHI
jgi:hypothetical protein